LTYINKITKRSVEYKPPVENVLTGLIILFATIVIFYLIYVYCFKFLVKPYLWLGVGIFIYFNCLAGLVYDVIHSPTLVGD